VGAYLVLLEMLIVDRAWSKREPALFAENFKNAAIASSPKMNEPARADLCNASARSAPRQR